MDQWSWSRDAQQHGGKDRQHRLQLPLEEKESLRWVERYRRVCHFQTVLPQTHLGYMADRDSDLFELFEEGQVGEADWLIRASQDRKLSDGRRLWEALQKTEALGTLEFDLPAAADRPARHVTQSLRAARLTLKPPYRPDKKLSPVEVTAILAWEECPPKGVEPIQWLLLTNLPVHGGQEAEEKVRWLHVPLAS